MANLVFKYSAMNGGKTINILQAAHNYEENGFKVTIIKAKIDTKGKDFIVSRVGLSRPVDILLKENESLLTEKNYKKYYTSKVILVDEVEFLTESQIEDLWTIAHLINIPVLTYGLKSNFKGEIFSSGVAKLFAVADDIEEVGSSSLCICGKRAVFNARKVNDTYSSSGDVVVIDGAKKNVQYIPLCGDCYLKYVKIKSPEVKKLGEIVKKVV
jgi:thymidine kinase